MSHTNKVQELIKVRGFQVAPAEIEGHLLGHEGIADAGVIGVSDVNGEEVPRAYVVPKRLISEDEIKAYLRTRLASYKCLGGGVVQLKALPRNASGKLLRRELRKMARRELITPKL
jgi:4-coumarate--CoA ligase